MVSAVVIGLLEPDIHGEKLIYPFATWICGGTILGLIGGFLDSKFTLKFKIVYQRW